MLPKKPKNPLAAQLVEAVGDVEVVVDALVELRLELLVALCGGLRFLHGVPLRDDIAFYLGTRNIELALQYERADPDVFLGGLWRCSNRTYRPGVTRAPGGGRKGGRG